MDNFNRQPQQRLYVPAEINGQPYVRDVVKNISVPFDPSNALHQDAYSVDNEPEIAQLEHVASRQWNKSPRKLRRALTVGVLAVGTAALAPQVHMAAEKATVGVMSQIDLLGDKEIDQDTLWDHVSVSVNKIMGKE